MSGGIHVRKRANPISFKNSSNHGGPNYHFPPNTRPTCTNCGVYSDKVTLRLCPRCYSRWRYQNNPDKREMDRKRSEYHNDMRRVERIIIRGKIRFKRDLLFKRGWELGFAAGYAKAKKRFLGDKSWRARST